MYIYIYLYIYGFGGSVVYSTEDIGLRTVSNV